MFDQTNFVTLGRFISLKLYRNLILVFRTVYIHQIYISEHICLYPTGNYSKRIGSRANEQILFSFLALASETSYPARLCLSQLLQVAWLFTENDVARGIPWLFTIKRAVCIVPSHVQELEIITFII